MGLRGAVAGIQPFAEISRRATTIVYKGYDSSLDRYVLLKVLRPEFAVHNDIADRFKSEAQLLARVVHPNVVSVYSYGEEGGVTYMATEYVEGQSLDELLQRGPLPSTIAAGILQRTAAGLAAAHAEGVLHRDFKPDNILVSAKGAVKLTDFGLAVSQDAAEKSPAMAGTLPYMAPEIIGGGAPSESSDLFAVGATFFEMLTGRRAFSGDSESEIIDGLLSASPMQDVELFTDAPSGLMVICSKLLQKDPAGRFASATELEHALMKGQRVAVEDVDIAAYVADPSGWAPPAARAKPVDDNSMRPAAHERRLARPVASWALAVTVVAAAIFLVTRLLPDADSGRLAEESLDSATVDVLNTRVSEDLLPDASTSERTIPILNEEQKPDVEPEATQPTRITTIDPVVPATAALDSAGVEVAFDTATVVAGPGFLAVRCIPWATIWIDGDSLATASLDTLRLASGDHEILLRNPDFPDVRRTVRIDPDEFTRLDVSLWSTVARLSLTVIPWAEIEIDGAVVDTIPPQVRPLILAPGAHRLRLIHPDLGEISRDIVLTAGEHRNLAYNMRQERSQ
ncbi:MAG: serine/threonine protein kinase [Rhodothermales bacterium]|nr:serine/threonine protein kinase [Rhodothermales bacterium]